MTGHLLICSTDKEVDESSLFPIYLALSATAHTLSATKAEIISSIERILPRVLISPSVDNAATEVARASGGELHNISSLTGGMVAQEIIKIITKQYIPIDNLCVFDGITSKTQVFQI